MLRKEKKYASRDIITPEANIWQSGRDAQFSIFKYPKLEPSNAYASATMKA